MSTGALDLLAQAIDEKIGDLTGYDAARAVVDWLDDSGFVLAPKQPTDLMLVMALPLAEQEPSDDDKRLGARACMILSGSLNIPNEGNAVRAAAQLAQDYRTMLSVSRFRAQEFECPDCGQVPAGCSHPTCRFHAMTAAHRDGNK